MIFVNNPTDWNSLNASVYGKGVIISPVYYMASKPIGFPDGAYDYGTLITFDVSNASPDFTCLQMYIPDVGASMSEERKGIYLRHFLPGEKPGTRWGVIRLTTYINALN